MKPLEVIVFYTDNEEVDFKQFIPRNAALTCHKLEQEADLVNLPGGGNTVVLIWDTTTERRGLTYLETIRGAHPEMPVFLIAANATEDYLIAALRLKATDFFHTYNLSHEALRLAIEAAWKSGKHTIKEKVADLFRHVRHSSFNFVKGLWPYPTGSVARHEVLRISASPSFTLTNKKMEREYEPDLSVKFFGNFAVSLKGKKVPEIKGRKNATVLAYLLYNHQKSIHKDVLMAHFWGNVNPVSARNSLNVAICQLRKHLSSVYPEQEVILYDNDSYCINPQLEILADIDKFNYFWTKGKSIEAAQGLHQALGAYNKAIELYKDEFLTNLPYEEWCEQARDHIQETYLFMLNRLGNYFFEQQSYEQCVQLCQRMLEKDNCLEEVHRKLMVCYYRMGMADLAMKQYFKCEKALEKELGLAPSALTQEIFRRIQQGIDPV